MLVLAHRLIVGTLSKNSIARCHGLGGPNALREIARMLSEHVGISAHCKGSLNRSQPAVRLLCSTLRNKLACSKKPE